MNKSKSSKCAAPEVASSKTQSKLLQMSADIAEVKPSNNGKSATIVICPTSRALKVEGEKVSSITPFRTIGEIEECKRSGRCFLYMSHMNSENGQKIAKVIGAKSVKHHGDKALQVTVSAKDLDPTGATADKATSFSDLQEEKNVSVRWFIWNEPEEEPEEEPSVFDLVEQDKDLSTLEAALKAADLDDNLDHCTLFAPNNAAFAQLASGAVADLLKLKNKEKLEKLLENHVVAGRFSAAKLKKLAHSATPYVMTLAGKRLQVKMVGQQLYVGVAKVVDADNKASNGYVHAINKVLA